MTKTCGECRFYFEQANFCRLNAWECIEEDRTCCNSFAKPTNGDKIRQMSNEELAGKFGYPCPPLPKKHCKGIDNIECTECWLDWLNAPAESEVKDE